MNGASEASEAAFSSYVQKLVGVVGHADRAAPLRDYCVGLMMPVGRKSVEPLAAVTAPSRVSAKHQSLLHFVGQAPWSDADLLSKVYELVRPGIERDQPIEAWIIDDTGFPKKGKHSVGVTRQYCGQIGKQDNCQVAVSLSVANEKASLPIAYRLYLPESWADDPERRAKAKIPDDVHFLTKPQIALEQVRAAHRAGVAPGIVLADAGYGVDGAFRAGVSGLGLRYVVGVQPLLSVWRPGEGPLPPSPKQKGVRGPSATLLRRQPGHAPTSARALALNLPPEAWQIVTWREGANSNLSSRFAAVRLHPASRDFKRTEPHPEEWLLIEWPESDDEPLKYWLSTLAGDTPLMELVRTAKMRWRIERDYQELKQELGLGHYEGRGWRGFHHHATLCIASYGFLISRREAIPPSAPTSEAQRQKSPLPDSYRPRGSPDPARASRVKLDRDTATTSRRRSRTAPPAMSLLHQIDSK